MTYDYTSDNVGDRVPTMPTVYTHKTPQVCLIESTSTVHILSNVYRSNKNIYNDRYVVQKRFRPFFQEENLLSNRQKITDSEPRSAITGIN